MTMTLGELDQAFGEKITPVIEPFPHYNSFIKRTIYCEFLGRTNDLLAPVYPFPATYKMRHKEVPNNLEVVMLIGFELGSDPVRQIWDGSPPPCHVEAPFRLTRGCEINAMTLTLRVSKY